MQKHINLMGCKVWWDSGVVSIETPIVSACLTRFKVQIANLDHMTVDARVGNVRLAVWTPADMDKLVKGVYCQSPANAHN